MILGLSFSGPGASYSTSIIPKNPSLAATLDLWDEQLAHRGATIARYRFEAVEQLSQLAAKAHASLTGGKETLSLRYITQAEESDTTGERLLARIRASREDDIRRLTTLVGVHRDDIAVMIDGKDARTFASQGQQRSAVLSVKLAQLEMTEQIGGDSPILMLDDVMSELDPGRRRQLIERIDRVQTFVTCTDVTDLAGARSCDIYRVENGKLLT